MARLPATPHCQTAFRDCKLLNSVLAPVVATLVLKLFRNAVPCNVCMHRMGLQTCSKVKPIFRQCLFQGCINLAEVTLSEFPSPRGSTLQDRTRELAPGCLSSTGIYTLALPKHFVATGAHACDSCRLLKSGDLYNTMIEEIPESTVFLPATLHTIRVKAFMNCAALVELAIPPSLKYIGSRAFLDCTALRRLVKMPGTRK